MIHETPIAGIFLEWSGNTDELTNDGDKRFSIRRLKPNLLKTEALVGVVRGAVLPW
jgi:hypothetical protein